MFLINFLKQFEVSCALSVDLNYKRGRQILHAVKKIIPEWVENIFEFEYLFTLNPRMTKTRFIISSQKVEFSSTQYVQSQSE